MESGNWGLSSLPPGMDARCTVSKPSQIVLSLVLKPFSEPHNYLFPGPAAFTVRIFLFPRFYFNLFCCGLNPRPHVLPFAVRKNNFPPSSLWQPLKYLTTAVVPPLRFLFCRLNIPSSSSLFFALNSSAMPSVFQGGGGQGLTQHPLGWFWDPHTSQCPVVHFVHAASSSCLSCTTFCVWNALFPLSCTQASAALTNRITPVEVQLVSVKCRSENVCVDGLCSPSTSPLGIFG